MQPQDGDVMMVMMAMKEMVMMVMAMKEMTMMCTSITRGPRGAGWVPVFFFLAGRVFAGTST